MYLKVFLRVHDATRENVIEKVTGEGAISYRTINNAGPRAIKLDTHTVKKAFQYSHPQPGCH
jgi:hypothetical protein